MKKLLTLLLIGTISIFTCKQDNIKDDSTKPRLPLEKLKYLSTNDYINSSKFNIGNTNKYIIDRIKDGYYNGYTVELCPDSLNRCNTIKEFEQYKKNDGSFITKISSEEWKNYSPSLKKEIIFEIIFYTWGTEQQKYNPLIITFNENSAFDFINKKSSSMFMEFGKNNYLKGGKGRNAYGPNCWYNAISSIVDSSAIYSKHNNLNSSSWNEPRFMGPTEFRCFMKKFIKVENPIFGDVVRYYTDSIYYDKSLDIYNGEVHAANFMGIDTAKNKEIVLTKNGRNDLGFLIFQDLKGVDSYYLSDEKEDPRRKSYYRVKPNSSFYDPALCGECSSCYNAYKIDSINYVNRLNCLAGKIEKDTCNNNASCYCYPQDWKLNL